MKQLIANDENRILELKKNTTVHTKGGYSSDLERLKKLGLIRREGAAKGGYWRVVNGDG